MTIVVAAAVVVTLALELRPALGFEAAPALVEREALAL